MRGLTCVFLFSERWPVLLDILDSPNALKTRRTIKTNPPKEIDGGRLGCRQKKYQQNVLSIFVLRDGTPSGNRTRVSPVAGEYSTTRPTV